MLNDHNPRELLGKWINLQVDGEKITAEPQFNKKKPLAAEKMQEVEDGFLNGASLGLNPIRFANGSEFGMADDILVLAESELIEASIVSIPSNQNSIQLYGNDGQPLADEELNKIRLSYGGVKHKSNQNRNMDFKSLIVAALGLKADATDNEVAAAMQTAFNNAKTLAAENAALKLAAETAEANQLETIVQGAVDAGKIPAEAKANYITLGKGNIPTVKSILDAIKPAVTTPVNLAAKLAADAAANVQTVANATDKSTWELKDWMEKDSPGLIALKASDFAAYSKLFADAGVPVQA